MTHNEALILVEKELGEWSHFIDEEQVAELVAKLAKSKEHARLIIFDLREEVDSFVRRRWIGGSDFRDARTLGLARRQIYDLIEGKANVDEREN